MKVIAATPPRLKELKMKQKESIITVSTSGIRVIFSLNIYQPAIQPYIHTYIHDRTHNWACETPLCDVTHFLIFLKVIDVKSEEVIENEPLDQVVYAAVSAHDKTHVAFLSHYSKLGLIYCHLFTTKDKVQSMCIRVFFYENNDNNNNDKPRLFLLLCTFIWYPFSGIQYPH